MASRPALTPAHAGGHRSHGRARRVEVFACDVDALQVAWASLPPGGHELVARPAAGGQGTTPNRSGAGGADVRLAFEGDGGPGAVELGPLPPGTPVTVTLRGPEDAELTWHTATLGLPGPERFRFATLSDVHIGERAFGHLPRVRDTERIDAWRSGRPRLAAYPLRCARAALDEALAWGAQLVVVKGDLSLDGRRAQYETLAELLAGLPVPVVVTRGNHDGGNVGVDDPRESLARFGLDLVDGLAVQDLPGLRLVVLDSVMAGHGHGCVGPVLERLGEVLRTAPGGALVALHHHPQRTVVPTHWPPGVLGLDGHRFLATVARAHADTLITAGHTHRHRRRRHGPVVITEVGSPKDYPGTWGGYVVADEGLVQVVRRIAAPNVIRWTERTRAMGLGQWGRWSPGRLGDRCFSLRWSGCGAGGAAPAPRQPFSTSSR